MYFCGKKIVVTSSFPQWIYSDSSATERTADRLFKNYRTLYKHGDSRFIINSTEKVSAPYIFYPKTAMESVKLYLRAAVKYLINLVRG